MVLLDNPSGSLGSEPEGLFFYFKGSANRQSYRNNPLPVSWDASKVYLTHSVLGTYNVQIPHNALKKKVYTTDFNHKIAEKPRFFILFFIKRIQISYFMEKHLILRALFVIMMQ